MKAKGYNNTITGAVVGGQCRLRMFGILLVIIIMTPSMWAQQVVSMEDCIAHMRTHSDWVKAEQLSLEAKLAESKGAVNLPSPILSMESPTGQFMTLGVTQTMAFPSTYFLQHQQAKTMRSLATVDRDIQLAQLEFDLRKQYILSSYALAYCALLAEQDDMYRKLQEECEILYQKGLIGKLTFDMAQQQTTKMRLKLAIAEREKVEGLAMLNQFCGYDSIHIPVAMDQLQFQPMSNSGNGELFLRSQSQRLEAAQRSQQLAKHRALPGLMLGYLNQGPKGNPAYYGLQFGITVPLWWWTYRAEIQSAKYQAQALESQLLFEEKRRIAIVQSATLQMKALEGLWTKVPPTQSMTVMADANRLLEVGEINFAEFVLLVEQSFSEREQWLQIKREMLLLNSTIHHFN